MTEYVEVMNDLIKENGALITHMLGASMTPYCDHVRACYDNKRTPVMAKIRLLATAHNIQWRQT